MGEHLRGRVSESLRVPGGCSILYTTCRPSVQVVAVRRREVKAARLFVMFLCLCLRSQQDCPIQTLQGEDVDTAGTPDIPACEVGLMSVESVCTDTPACGLFLYIPKKEFSLSRLASLFPSP